MRNECFSLDQAKSSSDTPLIMSKYKGNFVQNTPHRRRIQIYKKMLTFGMFSFSLFFPK